jgi:probable HAF family extracellular repeat protein
MALGTALVLLISGLGTIAQPSLADPINFTISLIDVPGSTATGAIGINNAGQIVGSYTDTAGNTHGFLDTNGSFTTLDFPVSTFTEPTGINNVGQIVGFYSGGAFLYQNGAFSNLPISAVTYTIGGPSKVAINDLGQIVSTGSNGRGFLYSGGQLTFLPLTGNFSVGSFDAAYSINNNGVIAGRKKA